MRLNAYVLAGDPAWAPESLGSYYHLVDRVIVAFDRNHRSWAGHPLQVDDAIRALRSADPENKIVLLPGSFSDPGRPTLEVETEHRQAALDAASDGCDWVLQLDTDEIVLAPAVLAQCLQVAAERGAQALDYPLRDFYQSLGNGRFLEHSGRFWSDRANYPGPVGVVSGSRLNHCRQLDVPHYRVDMSWRNTDPWHPRDTRVHAIVDAGEAIAHMSWVRTDKEMREKAVTSGYANAHNWSRDLPRWKWRQRHPILTAAATPFRRGDLERLRISHLDVSRGLAGTTAPWPIDRTDDGPPIKPAVDIVVATNRNTTFLREALRSVTAQTYESWRLIVVDDGCPDPEALEAMVKDVVPEAVVVHQDNAGQSTARNRGVRLGSAPLVTFLDDDDVWRTDRLALLVEALVESPSALASHSGAWYMDERGARFGGGRTATNSSSREMLAGAVPIPFFVTMLFRRWAFLEAGGFDESLHWAEDNDLLLKLVQIGQFAAVPQELLGYRRHSANLTNAPSTLIRDANDRMLRARIADAVARGDESVAALLRENHRRFVRGIASGAPANVHARMRRGEYSAAVADLGWVLARAPIATISAVTAKVVKRLRHR